MNTLPREFYSRASEKVAKDILGKVLIKGEMKGRIVEVEAYYGEEDPASHAFSGMTQRNESMYGHPGRLYVYLCYGTHYLLNLTTLTEGSPGAVLIRALEPLEGLKFMKSNRGTTEKSELTDGPGKLTEALGIDKSYNGMDVTKGEGEIRVVEGERKGEIARSKRIGVSEEHESDLRFFLKDSEFLSTT